MDLDVVRKRTGVSVRKVDQDHYLHIIIPFNLEEGEYEIDDEVELRIYPFREFYRGVDEVKAGVRVFKCNYHPHVDTDGSICLGSYTVPILRYARKPMGDEDFLVFLINILRNWANSYNPADCFKPIYKYYENILTCWECGEYINTQIDSYDYCSRCERALHADCG